MVFRNGEGALQTLPPLVDVIPEARLNLVIYLLKQDDIAEAYALIKDLEPTVPQEYILKGKVEKIFRRYPGLDPVTFTFTENSNYCWESLLEVIRQNIAG